VTEIGSTLGGRYRLLELLGQGGMATIYRARDAQLERDVAIKLLRPEFGQDPDFLARFRDEARAAASLSHPNVVAVFDFGEEASGPYIVMELVEGQDLASILRDNGPLAPRQAARIASDVAKALQAAHARGFVHRDVKPSNILIGRDGRVKVADFGIARAIDESQLTLPGVTMGSVHYFAPEQARGESATTASDVYALGIVLFEMLTGQRPFSGDGAAAVALARLTTTPPRPSALRPAVPAELDGIVLRAMALQPADRFGSAAAMAGALDGFLSGGAPAGTGTAAAAGMAAGAAAGIAASAQARPVASGQARPPAGPVPYPPDAYAGPGSRGPAPVSTRSTVPPPPPLEPDEDRSGPWAWIAGALAIGILVVVGFLFFRLVSGGGGTPTPSASPSGSAAVTVPTLTNMSYADAQNAATQLGLTVVRAASQENASFAPDWVLTQSPAPGTSVPAGTPIQLTVARAQSSVSMPDLRSKVEADALQQMVTAGLTVGTRSEAYDPFIPVGSLISTDPGAGIAVAPRTAVNYVVSKGPEPTPSPSPSATPTPSPTPSPSPTPTPTLTPTATPHPTPTPTPAPVNVGRYVCLTLDAATTAIDADGFALGVVTTATSPVPSTWLVSAQDPLQGVKRPAGTKINLTMVAPGDPSLPSCP
jgi:serine/threonine-protein kinase